MVQSSEEFVEQDSKINLYESRFYNLFEAKQQSDSESKQSESKQSESKQSESKQSESKQSELLFDVNPIFNILGINTQRTYADVVGSEPTNVFNMQFPNNVVTRERVQGSMYNILDEIEEVRESISENTYLNLSNQLRIVYDYISQNDTSTSNDVPPIRSQRRSRTRYNNIFTTQPVQQTNQENEGARNLTPLNASLYNLFKWIIRDAPFKKVWQILLLLLLFNISIIFVLIGTIIKLFQKVVIDNILKKILLIFILFAEEVLLNEPNQTYRNILLECIRLGRITLNW
jgi:hypothetical protein